MIAIYPFGLLVITFYHIHSIGRHKWAFGSDPRLYAVTAYTVHCLCGNGYPQRSPIIHISKDFYIFSSKCHCHGLLVPWPRLIVTLLQLHDKPPWWYFLSLHRVPNLNLIKIRATLLTLAFYCDGDETVVLIAIIPVHPPGRRELYLSLFPNSRVGSTAAITYPSLLLSRGRLD